MVCMVVIRKTVSMLDWTESPGHMSQVSQEFVSGMFRQTSQAIRNTW